MMNPLSPSRRGDRTKDLVGFQVGDVFYAVDIFRVREIINPLEIVVLPHAPDVVLGVAEHRGEVVPIIDLRRRFGLPSAAPTRRTKWLVVARGDRSVGLVVDLVTDVFGSAGDDQREVPQLGHGDRARGIASVYAHQGSLVFVIDVDLVAEPAAEIDIDAIATSAGVAS